MKAELLLSQVQIHGARLECLHTAGSHPPAEAQARRGTEKKGGKPSKKNAKSPNF
jgi:hypothetical protein